MKIKSGYLCHSFGGEHVVLAIGERTQEFHGIVRLNGTGFFLWQRMQAGDFSPNGLEAALIEEYGIDQALAQESVGGFMDPLLKAGIIEE